MQLLILRIVQMLFTGLTCYIMDDNNVGILFMLISKCVETTGSYRRHRTKGVTIIS